MLSKLKHADPGNTFYYGLMSYHQPVVQLKQR